MVQTNNERTNERSNERNNCEVGNFEDGINKEFN